MTATPGGTVAGRGQHRSAARLHAVQALYRIEIGQETSLNVVDEFRRHWINREIEGTRLARPDQALFSAIVEGVAAELTEIDSLIAGALDKDRRPERLEVVLRAVLRAAVFELLHCPDVPARVTITEYVDVAHAFFGAAVPAFVNGVVDRLARQLRPGELREASLRPGRNGA